MQRVGSGAVLDLPNGSGPLAAGSGDAGLVKRPLAWLLRRHAARVEVAIVVVGYLVYDASRGLAGAGRALPVAHARDVYSLERSLGIDVEHRLQQAVDKVPHLLGVFDAGYATLHLLVTGLVLAWAWWKAPAVFARLRTALLLASGIALVGFIAFPTAPPRMAGLGISDTVSRGGLNLESGWLQHFYNPYAAMPSLHLAYASLAGLGVVLVARHRLVRVLGVAYPLFVATEVVATGNHFVIDVLAGLATGGLGWAGATIAARHLPRTSHDLAAAAPAITPAISTVVCPASETDSETASETATSGSMPGRAPCIGRRPGGRLRRASGHAAEIAAETVPAPTQQMSAGGRRPLAARPAEGAPRPSRGWGRGGAAGGAPDAGTGAPLVDGDGPLGVVLSGGGARGAYEAGVLAELLPLLAADTPVIVVGTSAGAINAALLGAAIARRGDPMADPAGLWSSVGWRDVVGPLWRALASADLGLHTAALGRRPLPQALLDNDPLRQTLEARIDWLGLHRAVRDGALGALAVVATSAGNRRPVVFVEAGTTLAAAARLRAAATADPLADYRAVRLGPQHLMASAAIPALFPAVALPGAGAGTTEWFVDGGIERNAPVEAALALGARRLLVISPSPVPAARTPDAGAPTGPPGLLGGGLQLLETILGGQLSRELAAATVADGRRVPTLLVTPSSQGGDPLAEASAAVLSRRSGRRLTAPWDDGAILRRMAGDGPGADALVSYLHFDTAFLAAAVAQGREDGRRAVTAAALARIPTSTVRERPAATAPHGDDRSLHVRAVPATVGPLLHPERQS